MSGPVAGAAVTGGESDILGTVDVRPDPDGVRDAREFCLRTLASLPVLGNDAEATEDLIADAEIVTSELVTNAVRAKATRIVLEISRVDQLIRIAVLDDASGDVTVVQPEPLGLSGRGLRIVDTLAARWGVQPWPGAKTVWADLQSPPDTAP